MNRRRIISTLLPLLLLIGGCSADEQAFDAEGVFEADELIVSSEVGGRIVQFNVKEGSTLHADEVVGSIDDTQLQLQKKQLQAQIRATLSQTPDVAAQLASLQESVAATKREKERLSPLVEAGAIPRKQLDDAETQLELARKQLEAVESSLGITKQSLRAQTQPITAQIEQVNDQIARTTLINPIDGTVLARYAEQEEITAPGKALYKIANLSTMTLRAYVDGGAFSRIKLGDSVQVFVDDGSEGYREFTGTISWIANEAEFTPKTIRTKDERANLVYAVKITVPNNGSLKIGMYGEVKF
ncbi:MAG: HlyD family efflux transporter periplasmic adaptor subunit [Ignavibacteriae bacterium]|nr:HlyD family efflux transporter periplasmic adaptor subunit [Ignavibacteriota bacterium]MCB9214540.1 HlyD family efflux transporter periplasmic adaptor subunit [Ignavibacteria bacterium]